MIMLTSMISLRLTRNVVTRTSSLPTKKSTSRPTHFKSYQRSTHSLYDTTKTLIKSFDFDKEPNKELIATELHDAEIPSSMSQATIADRQLNVKKVSGMLAITKNKCKYGFPQAFVRYPVTPHGSGGISSGMIRLSCPHLVKAVDNYERNGGIESFNSILNEDNEQGKTLRSNFQDINLSWQRIRKQALTNEETEFLNSQLGTVKANNLINSGIIGITLDKIDDVKCLHAHIADTLIRGENCNKIGSLALMKLEEQGIDVRGCDKCYQQCDSSHVRTDDSYYYLPTKNKQKLRTSRINRIAHKSRVAESIKRRASNNTDDTNANTNT